MARKDVSDLQVVQAYADARSMPARPWPTELLMARTGECEKVCIRAMERAFARGLVDYGVSLRSGWVTDKGRELQVVDGLVRAIVDHAVRLGLPVRAV